VPATQERLGDLGLVPGMLFAEAEQQVGGAELVQLEGVKLRRHCGEFQVLQRREKV
jgi:hypothetical protein